MDQLGVFVQATDDRVLLDELELLLLTAGLGAAFVQFANRTQSVGAMPNIKTYFDLFDGIVAAFSEVK